MTRITVVLEYADEASVPRIGVGTRDFGNCSVRAVQFSDALEELEGLHAGRYPPMHLTPAQSMCIDCAAKIARGEAAVCGCTLFGPKITCSA